MEESAHVALRQLRSGGRSSHAGGPGGPGGDNTGTHFSKESLVLYGSFALVVLLCFCCFARCFSSYLREGGDSRTLLSSTCLVCLYFCGLNGNECKFWYWVFLRCWSPRSNRRTFPEPSLSTQASGVRPARSQASLARAQARLDRSASQSSLTTSLGRLSVAAEARTLVAPFEAPSDRVKSENAITECIICLEAFMVGEPLRILPCMHRYHKSCIDKWFMTHLSCPICKNTLGSDTSDNS